jgi:hypothetical protein
MKEKRGRNNLETVFGVTALPSDTWIRAQMDKTAPEKFNGIFNTTLSIADRAGLIEGYRVLDGGNHVLPQCAGRGDSETGKHIGDAGDGGNDRQWGRGE